MIFPLPALLTIGAKVIVQQLEQREAIPVVRGLLLQNRNHVNGKQRPEDLSVLNQEVAKPRECLLKGLEYEEGKGPELYVFRAS